MYEYLLQTEESVVRDIHQADNVVWKYSLQGGGGGGVELDID
jgi:hypothetical protein